MSIKTITDYLVQYKKLFGDTATKVPLADPNHEDTITTWWQAAAMIDWYINHILRFLDFQFVVSSFTFRTLDKRKFVLLLIFSH